MENLNILSEDNHRFSPQGSHIDDSNNGHENSSSLNVDVDRNLLNIATLEENASCCSENVADRNVKMVVGNVSGNFPFFQSPKLLLHCDRPPFSLDTTPPSEDIYKDYYPPICDFSTISEESTFSEESTLNKSASATTPNSSHAHKDLLNDGFFSFNNISEEEETLDHKY